MPVPPDELARWPKKGRYTFSNLSNVVGLTAHEIRALIKFGVFPAAQYKEGKSPSWRAMKVHAWAWGLKKSKRIADQVRFVLGRNDNDWAQ